MSNAFTFLMLPPQTEVTRQWAKRLADSVPGVNLVLAEDGANGRRRHTQRPTPRSARCPPTCWRRPAPALAAGAAGRAAGRLLLS